MSRRQGGRYEPVVDFIAAFAFHPARIARARLPFCNQRHFSRRLISTERDGYFQQFRMTEDEGLFQKSAQQFVAFRDGVVERVIDCQDPSLNV